MDYSELANTYARLEEITGKLKMTSIVAELFQKAPADDLPLLATLIRGQPFPSRSQKELEIGESLAKEAISIATGVSVKEIDKKFTETGDLGNTTEHFIKNRKQMTLTQKQLTVKDVKENLEKIAGASGEGSQKRKVKVLAELIALAKPLEARYIIRTVLEELRVGVGEGIVRDAIAEAFNVDPDLVERAYFLRGDYSKIIQIAKNEKNTGLKAVRIELGTPIKVMLAQKAASIEDAFDDCGKPAQFEYKYDGFRTLIHKDGDEIQLFSRRMEEISKQFPEIVKWAKKAITAEKVILDGETVGFKRETGEHIPFQELSRRIKRKYKIQEMVEKIPVTVYLFDLLYLNEESYLNIPFKKRRQKLGEVVEPIPQKFEFATRKVTENLKEANEFYKQALSEGKEGVIVKNLEAIYQPGSRVGYMVKLKPVMEPLDLVIIGAEWGEGKRSQWLDSYLLGTRNSKTGNFLAVGKMATGLTEDEFEKMTNLLKPSITQQTGKKVKVKPKLVVEVGYEEIQKSPKYESGYALRFPRLKRLRTETKQPADVDTVERISKLYRKQPGRQGKNESTTHTYHR